MVDRGPGSDVCSFVLQRRFLSPVFFTSRNSPAGICCPSGSLERNPQLLAFEHPTARFGAVYAARTYILGRIRSFPGGMRIAHRKKMTFVPKFMRLPPYSSQPRLWWIPYS